MYLLMVPMLVKPTPYSSPSSPPTASRALPGPTHIFGSQLLPYVALVEKGNKTFPQIPVLGTLLFVRTLSIGVR